MSSSHPRVPGARRPLLRGVVAIVLVVVLLSLGYSGLFGPAGDSVEIEEFLVTPEESLDDVAEALYARGLVKNTFGFSISYVRMSGSLSVAPGGYELSSGMDAWTVAKILSGPPRLAWVRIPEGYRKEQIAEVLAENLGWTEEEKRQWLTVDTELSSDTKEGVYFPDVYLIATDQTTAEVAARMRERFEHEAQPLLEEAARQGVEWTKVLTIASLIEREAAGAHDMQLIAGIIWNRLETGMPLGIDATLQYIRGEEGAWWPVPQSEDKYLESPYNTYFKPGLPPGPIANPGLESIAAVLTPETTSCFYYLHDYDGDIHCARTYSAHRANIDRYLR